VVNLDPGRFGAGGMVYCCAVARREQQMFSLQSTDSKGYYSLCPHSFAPM
jgi:hypothetical protein